MRDIAHIAHVHLSRDAELQRWRISIDLRRSAVGRTGGRDEIVAVEMKLEIGGNGGSLCGEHRSISRVSVIPSDLYASHKVTVKKALRGSEDINTHTTDIHTSNFIYIYTPFYIHIYTRTYKI